MGRYNPDTNNNATGLFTASEFKNRGIIKLAPDALVYLNGSDKASFIAPISGQSQGSSFQDGITSINIQNNVDPPGSSTATVEISTPIYTEKSSYWIAFKDDAGKTILKPRFVPMMEIQVYFKGRFLVGGYPKYYSAFWGFITNVEESYSGGMYKIQLQCADMLHWWQYIQVAFRPSVESDVFVRGQSGLTVYGSRYKMANPYEIIYNLCQQMGFENFIPPSWLGKITPNSQVQNPDPRYMSIYQDAFQYWNTRFSGSFGNNILRMYGASGILMNDPRRPANQPVNPPVPDKSSNGKSQQATRTDVSEAFDMIDNQIKEFQVFHEFDKMKDLDQAEYKTKLEIATEVKNRVEFEFFQDVNGNFVFKPPFFNLNTKDLLAYNIKPQDIITFSSALNTEELVTALEVAASPQQNMRDSSWVNLIGYHVDLDLVKKYGYRFKKIDSWWLSEAPLVQSHAVGEMGLINARASTGSLTIPGRPELRLGYPIYIDHLDKFFYVKSINHAFDFGGSFTTTLSLEAERGKVFLGNGSTVQKNQVYKYQSSKADQDLKKQTGTSQKQAQQKAVASQNALQQATKNITAAPKTVVGKTPDDKYKYPTTDKDGNPINVEQATQDLLAEKGLNVSVTPGIYKIVTDAVITSITKDTIPYTDEEGYKVIGGFKYGRGIIVKEGIVIEDSDPLLNQAPPNQIEAQRQANKIARMATEAGSEGESSRMATYFQANNQAGVEGAVVPYFLFPEQAAAPTQDPGQIATGMVGFTPDGAVREPSNKILPNK